MLVSYLYVNARHVPAKYSTEISGDIEGSKRTALGEPRSRLGFDDVCGTTTATTTTGSVDQHGLICSVASPELGVRTIPS